MRVLTEHPLRNTLVVAIEEILMLDFVHAAMHDSGFAARRDYCRQGSLENIANTESPI